MKLRSYQQEGEEAILKYLAQPYAKPSVIVHPTGAGKSVLIGSVISKINAPILVLQPKIEILEQNYEKLISYGGKATIYSASAGIKEISKCTFATLKSIKHLGKDFKKMGVKILFIDECDRTYSPEEGSEFMNFLNDLEPTHIIGFTATPFRLKTYGTMKESYSQLNMLNRGLPKIFKDYLQVVQIEEMIKRDFWADITYEQWDFDDSKLSLNTTGSEYKISDIEKAVKEQNVNNNIYRRVKTLIKEGRSVLAFIDSVENAEKLALMFGDLGACVHAKTPMAKRKKYVQDFKSGKIKAMFNYGALGVGFNYPELDTIIIGYPTNSLSNLYQWIGRIVRNPEYPKRKKALVIDFCNNIKRFGRIEDLYFENMNGYGWGLFSKRPDRDVILTGVPMGTKIYKDELIKTKKPPKCNSKINKSYVVTFGKHKGKKLSDLPIKYIRWLLNELHNFEYFKDVKEEMREVLISLLDVEQQTISFDKERLIIIDLKNVSYILHKHNNLNANGLKEYMRGLAELFGNSNIIVVSDSSSFTYWRKKVYPEYKQNRLEKEPDMNFINKFKRLKEEQDVISLHSFEADDIIADYVRRPQFKEVIVVSADGDFKQLGIFNKFKQFNPLTRKFIETDKLSAMKILIEKVLKGDRKDNIFKCHNNKAIKSSNIDKYAKQTLDYIKQEVKNGITDFNDINLQEIIYNVAKKDYNIDKQLYDMNFTLNNLTQDMYAKFMESQKNKG